ncbi:MAG: TRAP transporter small permease [Vibrio sp.]
MRAVLDKIYLASGAIAGISIILICLFILARVFGRWFGIVIPSSDDFAGYLLASASFLSLAYAFKSGAHIRVSLFTSRLAENSQLWVERIILVFASLLVCFLAYQLVYMVWESWDFEDVTTGYIPMPLWLVQLPMSIGAVIFAISVIDITFCSWIYKTPIPKSEEELLAESETIDMTAQNRGNIDV